MSLQSEVDEVEWPEILEALRRKTLQSINCAMPGRIVSYDDATQTATVQVVVQIAGQTLKPIEDVPVLWPGGAGGFLHTGLVSGDNVVVLFLDEDFSAWWDSGSISPAVVDDRHGLHAVAFPGLRRAADPLSASTGDTVLGAAGDVLLGSDTAAKALALAELVDARLSTLQAAHDSHIHVTTATIGSGPTPGVISPTASPVGPLATTASTKVKADS